MLEKNLIPIYLPQGLFGRLRTIKRYLLPSNDVAEAAPPIDLTGDRDIEWSYVASRLPQGNGYVLDFGCGVGTLSIIGVLKGHRVLALDLEQNEFPWSHPNLSRLHGDLLKLDLPEKSFDFVLNCSTVEHVGLSGRYGVSFAETDGDLAAMHKLGGLLKPHGAMLLTIPCGRDAVIAPWHRVYGMERLPKLLEGYRIEEQIYWTKGTDNRWRPCDRQVALSYIPTGHPTRPTLCSYALGCFVLSKVELSKC